MSYRDVLTGLHTVFEGVSPPIPVLLRYEPTAIHQTPTLYSLLDSVDRQRQGQINATRYRVLNRLVVRWQDNEHAEEELIPYVDALAAAIDSDAHLGGAISSGIATVNNMEAVFVSIGGVIYRALDIYADVLYKTPIT
jgi:hypothetical protein